MQTTLLFLLTLIVLVAIPVAIVERYFRKLKQRHFPFSDSLLRPAGYSCGKKRDELKLEFLTYLLGTIFIAYLACIFIFVTDNIILEIFGWFLILGETYLVKKSYELLDKTLKYDLGYAGELAVGQSLNQLMLDGYHVFHDLVVDDKFNLDHVIVGKNGVFAIETKAITKPKGLNGKKQFRVEYNGSALFFENKPQIPHTKFIKQTLQNAQWLRKELTSSTGQEVNVTPVLVLPGWQFKLKIDQNNASVKLLNHNKLDALEKLKTGIHLTESDITRIIHQLKQKCENLDMNKGRWGE